MRQACWRTRQTLLILGIAAGPLAGCAPSIVAASPTPAPLQVEVLYPAETTQVVAGDRIRFTIQVMDAEGAAADEATVACTLRDGSGEVQAAFELRSDGHGIFRAPTWSLSLRAAGGPWQFEARAVQGDSRGAATRPFVVSPSLTRILHDKYGFWIDPPTLGGIVATLAAERGDAENGMIRWGGSLPAAHILPSAWIDVEWRRGDFGLTASDAVRRFLLEDIGDLGASRVRSLGEPHPTKFKGWDAWLVPARGELRYEQVEWLVFYAAEVDRTFALGTTIVQPPTGIDAPETLRRSFEIDAGWEPSGVAPEPLPALLPGPVLREPQLGAEFAGAQEAIDLRWEPLRALREGEYYEVVVQYAYVESTPLVRYATRETRLRLPSDLYDQPNCGVFNWYVRLMQSTGAPADEGMRGVPLSHPSPYSYLVWRRPAADPAPFPPLCPNEQT